MSLFIVQQSELAVASYDQTLADFFGGNILRSSRELAVASYDHFIIVVLCWIAEDDNDKVPEISCLMIIHLN